MKANIQVNYVSDSHNTEDSSDTGLGPADYFFVIAAAYSFSRKVILWHILTTHLPILSFIPAK